MSTAAIELPLFPLKVVLFPGTILPLHIFETRYRQMILDCLRDQKPFGVVLAKPESQHMNEIPYPVGTMAEIHKLDRLEDGRYKLVAFGLKRFRILSQHREKPYLSGLVEPYEDDEEPEDVLAPYAKQAHDLFSRYLGMVLEATNTPPLDAKLPETPEALSHFIAYFLEAQDEQKQRFLEMTSTQQRLQGEIAILRREIPFMRQMLLKRSSNERAKLN
jgi:Lon protease-like protein